MRIERVSRTGALVTIADVKAFANISTSADDAMLQKLLNSALNKVEEVSNVSLSANTIRFYSEKEVTKLNLFILPVATITSVLDLSGVAVGYTQSGFTLTLDALSDVVVTYTTSAVADDELKQTAIEVTSAMYDGEDYEKILQKIMR